MGMVFVMSIPLGYKQVDTRDEADRLATPFGVFPMGLIDGGEIVGINVSVDGAVYLRCTLPPEIATHWQPAPGSTHAEQWANAWPMGQGSVAVLTACGSVFTAVVDMHEESDIPVVPRTVAAEREACARVCDDRAEYYRSQQMGFDSACEVWDHEARESEAESLAEAIRARGAK